MAADNGVNNERLGGKDSSIARGNTVGNVAWKISTSLNGIVSCNVPPKKKLT